MEIADRVRKAMIDDGRSLTEIADKAQIHRINLYQFKSGTRNLGIEPLHRLAEVVGLELTVRPKKRRR